MRHRLNTLKKLSTWVQKKQTVIRNLMTSLVEHWRITTTPKQAKVLKSHIDSFISRLLSLSKLYKNEADQKREAMNLAKSTLFTKSAWKKLVDELIVKYAEEKRIWWFTRTYLVWTRKWDNIDKWLVELI